jgi:eukaryotic-like serine/threonine-protein kinase
MTGLQRIGPYVLVRRIASGGMAEVWMGRRQAMGGASKAVAIKLLASHLAEKPVYRRMFVDEARLTMMLTHSNIVQVFDVGEHGGRSYLVMEWVDGMDLSQLVGSLRDAGEVLPMHVTAHIIGEVLRGLAYAHDLTEGDERSAIVHRDISPHNVLLSVSGEVKVSDFGVARLASEETSGLHVRGKLRYMPPEQVRGESRHATCDLFAVGAVLQELLDGVRFRAGLERDALFGMVIHGEAPPLRREVPPELRALRDGLLTADRSRRIQSAEQALALLRRWPGYRNAADELAQLIRTRAGVAAPRTGLTVAFSDEELEALDEPTVREGSDAAGSSDLETRTVPSDDHAAAASETTPSVARAPARAQAGAGAWLAARRGWFAVAGLGVALGFGWSWFGAELHGHATKPTDPIEPIMVVGGAAAERAELGAVALEPAQGEAPTTDERLAVEAAAGLELPSDPAAEVDESPRPKAKGPAKVEFAAHEFFFVWIKVAGRERALEPVTTLSLRPGKHAVRLRESAEQPWRSAGQIEVEAGRRYRVSLRKPAALTLEPLK